jgi:hypothetical protein
MSGGKTLGCPLPERRPGIERYLFGNELAAFQAAYKRLTQQADAARQTITSESESLRTIAAGQVVNLAAYRKAHLATATGAV